MSGWFLLGAPWDCSGTGRGEAAAPDALRAAGLVERVDVDLGNAATHISTQHRDQDTGVRALPDTITAARSLASALGAGLRDRPGLRPLVVGGDCSLLLGVFAHLRAALGEVGLWFLDGHPDFYDGHGSETGETADLELAVLTGDGPPELVGLGGVVPMVAARHVALIGHRTVDLDPESAAEVARLPDELFRLDAPAVIRDPAGAGDLASAWGEGLGLPMWLHIDVDVLDEAVLPAVTYPQAGGPDFGQLATTLRPLTVSGRLLGVSVADFRPDLDGDGRHAARLVDLLDRVLEG
ncbi:arginase [Asanoa ishikariensis]|uniref:Arginase n=1 Tax=Asanoa ishikariensis TaxID=137265 RepID=A0A1H3UF15_9ACTN|nr:arginase family protein [Asanoa ishikariensis]GIF63790.1 arginase [Asanoa ishikariensis]SDZ60445.1 arginase [Asanoa ishikariensis]